MRKSTITILFFDLLIATLCAMGIYRVSERAQLPFDLRESDSLVIIGGNTPWIVPETPLLMIDSVRVTSIDEVEFILNSYHPNDIVIITIGKVGNEFSAHLRLTEYYSVGYLVIQSLATLIYLLIGIVVFIRLPHVKVARTLHHLSLSIACLVALTTGNFTTFSPSVGQGIEKLFHFAYVIAPIFFLAFTFDFPKPIYPLAHSRVIRIVSLVGAGIYVYFLLTFDKAVSSFDARTFAAYALSLDLIRMFFALLFLTGLSLLFISYKRAATRAEIQQLRWIFFGVGFGAMSFILLWQIPEILFNMTLIPEEIMLLLSTIAPVSFAIAVVKYKAFDINLVIKRTIVYAVVIGLLVLVYILIVTIVANAFTLIIPASSATAIIASLLIAFLFEPLRERVQSFVDKKFFRAEYDARLAEREMSSDMKRFFSLVELSEYVIEIVSRYVPTERIGFFTVEEPNSRLRLLAHNGFDILTRRGVTFQSEQLKTNLSLPVLRESLAPLGEEYEKADDEVFSRWHIAAAFPIKIQNKDVSGFIVLGPRLSGTRFTSDDIEFIKSVALQASINVERIRLHEELILEHAESERLAELNRLKTYFVSSVSHDLKTPLASIKMFAEMLKDSPTLASDKREKYLSIIEGESERLARLITNVLDFAKLERGVKEYHKERCDLTEITYHVLDMMNYQFEASSFVVEKAFIEDGLTIIADKDAISDSIMNLLTNAMKYSGGNKNISISTGIEGNFAFVQVEDNGVGIPDDKLDSIFEAFYRVGDVRTDSVGGAGLGLSIVKHTIDAHHGRISVDSIIGKGSVFTIYLPLEI